MSDRHPHTRIGGEKSESLNWGGGCYYTFFFGILCVRNLISGDKSIYRLKDALAQTAAPLERDTTGAPISREQDPDSRQLKSDRRLPGALEPKWSPGSFMCQPLPALETAG